MKVDYNRLADLESNLTTALNVISNEFESAQTLSFAVGDSRLGQRSVQFRDSWDKHRLDIRDELEYLRDSVKNIATELEKVDANLATGISTPAPIAATPAARPSGLKAN